MSPAPADMQALVRECNARLVRRGLAVVAAGGVLAVALSAVLGGADAVLGAVVALGIVLVFYGSDVWLMRWTAPMEPVAVFGIVVMAYLLKLTLLAVFLVALRGTDLFSVAAFAATVIGETTLALGVAVWLSARATTFVEPEAS